MSQSSDRKELIVEPAPSDDTRVPSPAALSVNGLGSRNFSQNSASLLCKVRVLWTCSITPLDTAERLEAEYGKVLVIREKREAALPAVSLRPIECLAQAAVRLAFSTAMRPAIASSTATLACSIDAIA